MQTEALSQSYVRLVNNWTGLCFIVVGAGAVRAGYGLPPIRSFYDCCGSINTVP
eukprot:m.73211 g.73211  ORF g.73211 m.73211 type:complete len:54 (-) comp12361_c0_seq3:1020-1181(-)